ncbi:F-box/FBD/LRR-repeat protein At3g26920-like [Hevea brasiliensis]|uniref:F-box/FBD/LRR-repeat protein At3g26920-like n=1 Tax=Hevea brasiliensis TaxID=3981 RepID=UPI0025FCBE73|nr:F-box/FBD/LRR-repeat protein At3g26920-like [Hevea brasiliensis]
MFGCKYKTDINAPSLHYLELRGITLYDYSVNFSSSLVEACISGRCDFGLLKGISKAKHLTLNGDVMWSLHIIIRAHAFPTFHNLKKMVLHVGKPVNWEFLPNLLMCSPKLEALVVPEGLVVPKESGRHYYRFYWHRPESVAECLLLHLKTIEIFNFVGLPGELYLVSYLLERAEVLDRMTIHSYDFSGRPRVRKKMESIRDEAFSFPIRSSTCKLVFII